ncbi:Bug family tripartite tricarboxylate transporter substrate binding protein [Advenella mimigardefordensis]|uniref:Putative Bug-like extracytoplasmic solute binding receptor, TTT family n=1 Tax=Advenella mimigardefordensis (strain DSM 17166 / LMG 22922 / DPN7) TaxID=1247726 RepID=W0P7B6_ADVMD|nr:tripartite tricarboxylate transporter substrate binding protein [Advenella mimigardefordensis]AHG62729.1 putative Bug-like extracytoplasmic solute binding receptor, TTT family [Advenella mimigardefordensis DPN7]
MLTSYTLNRRVFAVLPMLAVASTLFFSNSARAADWPSGQPINIIVPFAPGGFTDLIARRLALDLGRELKTSVVVQNKAGASGQIGSAIVAREKPDGYTLLVTATQHVIYPALQPHLPYDPKKDFSNIAILALAPNVLLVPAQSPVNSVKELVDYAKKQPDGLAFGSSGVGGSAHLSGELFKLVSGANLRHIPYKGAAPAATDLIGAQIPSAFLDATSASSFIQSGKARALAVTSKQPLPSLPSVPTIAESGYPSYESQAWVGLFGPPGLPTEIITKLNHIAQQANTKEDNIKWLSDNNSVTVKLSPQQVTAFIHSELDKWQQVVNEAHVTAQ